MESNCHNSVVKCDLMKRGPSARFAGYGSRPSSLALERDN